jgi:serine/threonine-protein kinase
MPATTQSEFLHLLQKSRLLSQRDVEGLTLEYDLSSCESSNDVAKKLVKSGVLTKYQAQLLLDGRYRGLVIDQYRVLELLGYGGIGRLYLAENTETEELVAIKVLHEKYRHDTDMLTRLKLEAEAGRRLQDSRIVRTLQVNDTGAICYLVMEFFNGINLLELVMMQGALPWPQVCEYIRQGALALQSVHDQNIVHRDVKPENFLINKRGDIKLLDFGLALLPDEGDSEFSLSMIFGHDCIGSPEYIPPEQSLDAHLASPQSDQYSLGCTMFVLLAKQFVFPRKTHRDKILAHRQEEPPSLSSLVPGIPEDVERICNRMLKKDPQDRFDSMTEVADVLAPFAKRIRLDFSLNEVIKKRVKAARERLEQDKQLSQAVTKRSSSTIEIGPPHILIDSQMETETQVSQNDIESHVLAHKVLSNSSIQLEEIYLVDTVPAVLVWKKEGCRIPLTKARFTVGRAASCDVSIPAPEVSSLHCELLKDGEWWCIYDLNSRNGILVNGKKVNHAKLNHGDRITIAHVHDFYILDPQKPNPFVRRWIKLGLTAIASAALGGLVWWHFFAH